MHPLRTFPLTRRRVIDHMLTDGALCPWMPASQA